jgi:Ca-activated chloride channel family protein
LALSVIQELRPEGGAWRLIIPTVVAPRYSPASVSPAEQSAVSPPYEAEVTTGIRIRIRLEGAMHRVESPSHAIRAFTQDDHVLVELSHDEAALDRDLVIIAEPRTTVGAVAWQEESTDGSHYLAVDYQVPEEAPQDTLPPRDVVFLVDCSGSMSGSSIAEARTAVDLCVRQLSPGDRFQVIRFGSLHEAVFYGFRPYEAATIAAALQRISGMQADNFSRAQFPRAAINLYRKGFI